MNSKPDLESKHQAALEAMRVAFDGMDGIGMPLNDQTFLRYLRARNFNLEKATKMLHATLEFRKSFDLSGIQTTWKETIEFENASGKTYVRGFDKEGHVILYMKPRNENSKSHDGNLKHVVWNLEKAIACMEATTRQEKMVLIIDYDGFSMSNAPPMKTSKATLNILQDHYPERLFRAYVIRPLTLFYGFFKMISPFIDPITKAKIVMLTNAVLASDDNQLFQEIDRTVIESCVGGYDSRPFESKLYLAAPFSEEYLTALKSAVVNENSIVHGKVSSAPEASATLSSVEEKN